MRISYISRISVGVALLCASLSCSDFLEEKVTTAYEGNVMESADSKGHLEGLMLGCHRQFAVSGFKTGNYNEWLAPASGILHFGYPTMLDNPLERWTCCLKFTRFSQHPEAYSSFSSLYRAVYLCNSMLETLRASKVEDEYKEELVGETLFLRAMSYFWLVRIWGDVSLSLTKPVKMEDLNLPRENFWVVYCQIIKDLDLAVEKMRSFDRMLEVAGGNASGRVCDYTAIACRSLVYLTIGTLLAHPDDNFWVNRTPDFSEIGIETANDAFLKALDDAENVITHGPFRLCPDYRQLFSWTNPEDWQLRERIWALPRSPKSNDSGSALTMWALPDAYLNTSSGANYGRCRPDRWFFQKWCETYGGVKGTSANNSDIYVKCGDPRMNVNIIHTSYIGAGNQTYYCYPSNARMYAESENLMKRYGMPYFKKYYDPSFDDSVGNSDFYVMRLAEVYLIAAEACANLCSTPTDDYGGRALDYVNVILERARNSTDDGPSKEPHAWTEDEVPTKEALINRIFWERCFEMPFEQHEYFDTHRMGAQWIVDNISKPKNVFLYLPEQEDFEKNGVRCNGYRTSFYGAGFKYDEDWTLVRKGLISAYPYSELIYNSALDLNRHDPNYGQNPIEVYWR